MTGEWNVPVSPSPSIAKCYIGTPLGSGGTGGILSVVLTQLVWESVMSVEKQMKTLATFQISIPKCADGYLQINCCHASLIYGLHSLKKKVYENIWKKDTSKNWF